ncbi:MAG: hypothetical protein ACK5MY_02660 [Jhaorihella sp.]
MTHEIREAMRAKGVLTSMSIGCWSGNKLDKNLSDAQRQASNAAAANSIRVHKSLISDERLKVPIRLASEARRKHAELTLPWHYDGVGLLAADLVLQYDAEMGSIKARFWEAVQEIETGYRDMIISAMTELGSAFQVEDYPHVSQLRSFYHWNIRFERIPETDVDDLRLSLPEDVVDIIRDQVSTEHDHLVQALVSRIGDTVGRALDRLEARDKDEKAKLFQSTFDKLEALPSLLGAMNVTGNPEIEEILDTVRGCSISVDEAKNDAGLRSDAITGLAEIQQRLKQFYPNQGE